MHLAIVLRLVHLDSIVVGVTNEGTGNYEGHAKYLIGMDQHGFSSIKILMEKLIADLFGYDVATTDPGDIIMVSGNRNDGTGLIHRSCKGISKQRLYRSCKCNHTSWRRCWF